VSPKRLRELLTYPVGWGPSEWGPISFLPQHDLLVANMERQWGDLDKYRGLSTSAKGETSSAQARGCVGKGRGTKRALKYF